MKSSRRGFVLIVVLWIVVGLAVIGAAATAEAHDALRASRNRVAFERAVWLARGCVATAQGAVERALSKRPGVLESADTWRMLARRVRPELLSGPRGCTLTFEADGDRLNPSHVGPDALLRHFESIGLGSGRDDLADALLDWVDADDETRPRGAEATWYESRGRFRPRNARVADPAELGMIAGFSGADSLQWRHIGSSRARVSVNTAPREVLIALPGFGPEVIDRLMERRARAEPIHDLAVLPNLVGHDAAERLRESFADLVRVATADPEAWLITATASDGQPPVEVYVEARVVRDGSGSRVTRWRVW